MASKKKNSDEAKTEFKPEAVLEIKEIDGSLPNAPKIVVKIESDLCGHVNRHRFGTDGNLQELTCDLKPEHAGDHHAKCMVNVPDYTTNEKGIVTSVKYHQEERDGYWTDAAGTPVKDIKVGEVPAMNMNQKDMVLDIMKKNPRLNVDQAITLARSTPEWNVPTQLT